MPEIAAAFVEHNRIINVVFSSNTSHGHRNLSHNKRLPHCERTRAKGGNAVTNVNVVERFE
jgi:hypothetical protein